MRWVDRLLLFATALIAVVSVLPLGARLSWMLELTTHFRVQYLAVTVVLLAFMALRRRWGACAVLVAAGAVSAVPVLPYLPLTVGSQATAAAPPIKVLSVNVSFLQFSGRRLLEIMKEADPDIIIVEELTPHAEGVLAPLDTAFPHHRKFPADGAYGIGLWSRFALESSETFALGRVPAIEARLRGPTGDTFTVIGVHLRAPTTARRASARNLELRELAARINETEGAVIVAGDFNATPYTPYFRDWLKASGLTDSRRGRTLSISWPTTFPWVGIPIDHVAVSDDFTILSHRRLPNFESDHYGILVEVALRGSEQP
jgi:endonuclease/exonuclease/phosphatase (EEP) superfamily protein YafD